MNDAQRRAIENAIGNAADNLYRAKMQQRAMPTYRSGNGVPIDEMIADYERHLAELKENFPPAGEGASA